MHPLNCELITGQSFRPLFDARLRETQLASLIAEGQGLAAQDLQHRQMRDLFCLDWQKDGVSYTAGLQNQALLFITMRIESGKLAAREVIACLGAPQRVQAWFNSWQGSSLSDVQVTLVYSMRGIMVQCSQHFEIAYEAPPAVDDGMPVTMINVFGAHWGEEEVVLGNSRPWPRDWRDIEIESFVHEPPPGSERDQAADALPVAAVDEVLAQIDAAFGGAPRPPDDDLLHPDTHDDNDIQALIGVPHWRQLPDASVEYEYSALAFLGPAGFRHFLPAYMSWVLRHPESGAAVVGSTIFALSPAEAERHRQYMLSKYSLFDDAQRAAVVSFLRVMANFEDVRVALDYWYPQPSR